MRQKKICVCGDTAGTQKEGRRDHGLQIRELELYGNNLDYLKNRYIYKDYLVLYYFFVDNNIESQNGYGIKELKEKIRILRKAGCREYTLAEKVVSTLYRHHLHFLLTLVRKIRSVL